MTSAQEPQPLSAPIALNAGHDVSAFDCDKPPLNDWLRNRAMASEGKSARCYVVCAGNVVVGYYCIATGAVERDTAAPKKLRHGLPESVPVILLARLAVDKTHHRRGIGSGLLKDALRRILNASGQVGARAVLVHAIDDDAATFYRSFGFKPFPPDSRTLFLPLEHIAAALTAGGDPL